MSRRFGIEVELIGLDPARAAAVINAAGITCYAPGYTHSVSNTWKAVTDGSLGVGAVACEVVSPPLPADENGFRQVAVVLDALTAAGAGINRKCGLHVHVDAAGLSGADIANIVLRYARHEVEIDAFMPPSRRASNNVFCQSMIGCNPRGETPMAVVGSLNMLGYRPTTRYAKVNLNSYVAYGTVEFRQHSGTTDATKAINWIKFLVQFVEASRTGMQSTGTVAQHIAVALSRSEQRIVAALRNGPTEARRLAELSGLTFESMRCGVSALRKKGYGIVLNRRTSEYSMVTSPRPTPMATVTAPASEETLWRGIDAGVRAFYATRTVAFQQGN